LVGFEFEVGLLGVAEQDVAVADVALAVRDVPVHVGELEFFADDALEDARRHEDGGRVDGAERFLQVGLGHGACFTGPRSQAAWGVTLPARSEWDFYQSSRTRRR